MTKNEARKMIAAQLRIAAETLSTATSLANSHSISFVWERAPFPARYNSLREEWEVEGSDWAESGCTIGYDDLECESWRSSENC